MDQLKRYILSHKLQAILTLVLIPLIFLGLYLVLQQTVFKPKAGGGVTHDLKISLVSGAKSELAPSETTSIVVTSDLGTENILGFDILLNYDSNQFEVTEVLPGQIFNTAQGGKGLVTVKRHENGEIKLSWAAYNSPLKPYITDMASSYGSNPSNVELLKVKVKANANSSGGSNISFGEDSKNIIVTVEGGGNKAQIINPRQVDFEINRGSGSAATLSLNPSSGSFKKGCDFSTQVILNTGGATTDGTDAILLFDKNVFTAKSINSGTLYQEYPGNSVDNNNGKVVVLGIGSINQPFTGSGTLATVVFTVNSTAPTGTSVIRFDFDPNNKGKTTDSNVVERSTIKDVLNSVSNGTYTVEDGVCGEEETNPSKPIVSAACVGGSPTLNISWRGTVGRGSDADEANRGKNGFYVDLSISSGFDFVYNKFVETTQTSASTTAPSGFVLANAGRSDTGSPLSLSAGHGYFVRVYNGTHSPVSERVAIPACS